MTREQRQGKNAGPIREAPSCCRAQRAAFPATVYGTSGHCHLPVTDMVPILSRSLGLPSPKLESVLKCEHKYWGRLQQQRAIPEAVPAFQPVDSFDPASIDA